jgi:uncharacterized membrane protein YidH (DUF202 family)
MMKFFKNYKYLYYQIDLWNIKNWGERTREYHSLAVISILVYLNVLTLFLFTELFTGFSAKQLGFDLFSALFALTVISLLNYFVLVHNGKYNSIIKQFSRESETSRRSKSIWSLFYVILSIVSFSVPVIILSHRP